MRGQHGGHAAEDEHQNPQEQQPREGDARSRRVVEGRPGEDGADVEEAGKVEEGDEVCVDRVLEAGRVRKVVAVPV